MKLIDADRLCEDLLNRWNIADTRKEELIRQVMADIVTPIVISQPTVEPQKWIPVSERLPDLDKYVLCTVNDQGEGNEVAMMCLTTSIRADDYYWTDYACEYSWELCEVFAWMPLPDPWEGEEE